MTELSLNVANCQSNWNWKICRWRTTDIRFIICEICSCKFCSV